MKISRRAILSAALASTVVPVSSGLAAPPVVRIGARHYGTSAWELHTIRRNGFDTQSGISLEPVEFAAAQATQVALQAGRVDMILLDWLWVARQRAAGADWTFAPYSTAVGSIVARPASAVHTVRDLAGARLGIAGSPLDKSWLIFRAYAKRVLGIDLADAAKTNFGAPPLLAQQLKAGQLDAELTYWPYAARAEAAGMRPVMGVDEAVKVLGIDARIPFVGYVFSTAWAKANEGALNGFVAATRLAQDRLEESDEEWQILKPLTGARNDAELMELARAYRKGIVRHWGEAERTAIQKLYGILADIGGPALVGKATQIPAGTFWPGAF